MAVTHRSGDPAVGVQTPKQHSTAKEKLHLLLSLSQLLLLSANMLKVSSHPRPKKKKKKNPSENVMYFLLGEGKNKWKRINYERKRREFFTLH